MNEQLLKDINDYIEVSKNGPKLSWVQKNLPSLWDFFSDKEGDSLGEKIYIWMNGNTHSKCKVCGMGTKFLSYHRGYRDYCSKKCSNSDPRLLQTKIDSYKNNFTEKWGVDNPMKVDEYREKLIETKSKLDYGRISEKAKKTFLKNLGVDNPSKSEDIKEKKKITTQKNWGVDNPFKSEEIKKKIKLTNIQNLGVDSPLKSDVIKKNMKETLMVRLGVDNPMKSPTVREKFRETCFRKWGANHPLKSESIKDELKRKFIESHNTFFTMNEIGVTVLDMETHQFKLMCWKCSEQFTMFTSTFHVRKRFGREICPNCNPIKENLSYIEKTLSNFINENYGGEIVRNFRIENKEIDIYLPDLKLGIEFNGVYWHSSKFKDKYYHTNKYSHFKKLGIDIITIWEDDFLYKEQIVKSMVMNKIGSTQNKIHARKCQVKLISDNNLVRNFLEANHIQGFVGSKVKIGLFFGDELVSLMTFGELRKSLGSKIKDGHWELLRFCNKLNTIVIGGASKILKFFVQNFEYEKILSYSKNDYSNGGIYKTLGFNLDGQTPSNYYWVVNGKRINRFNFRKDKLIKMGEDKNLSETQIMEGKGYYKVYDSGNLRWFLEKPISKT